MKNYNQAFLESLDDKMLWDIVTIKFPNEIEVDTLTNTHLWPDGAPVTKYFEREEEYDTLKLKGEYEIVTYGYDDWFEAYYFDGNKWHKFELDECEQDFEIL